MAWDYVALSAQINRGVAGDRTLSPATLALCLAALSRMDTRDTWDNAGSFLTDAQWDIAENWLDTAYNDLLVPDAAGGVGLSRAYLSYQLAEGNNGASITQNYDTTVPIDTVDSDVDDIVLLHGSNAIKPIAGIYDISAWVAIRNPGAARLKLIHATVPYVTGINSSIYADKLQLNGIFSADGETDFYLVAYSTSASAYMGRKIDDGTEIYARVRLTRIGDND